MLVFNLTLITYFLFSPHAYLFFNPDGHTMTFLGFNIEKQSGNLIDDTTGEVLQERLMEPTSNNMEHSLYNGLNSQPGVNLSESFDSLERYCICLNFCKYQTTLSFHLNAQAYSRKYSENNNL